MRKIKNSSPRQRLPSFFNFFAYLKDKKLCFGHTESSLSVILPSIWNINSGCPSRLHLYPFDADGDTIECLWVLDENNTTNVNPAFELDQSECIITYNPALNDWGTEKSVMTLEIRDHRENETDYLSSIPVQFTTNILKQDEFQNSAESLVNNSCHRQGLGKSSLNFFI